MLFLIGTAFVALGIYGLYCLIREYINERNELTWPIIKGTVTWREEITHESENYNAQGPLPSEYYWELRLKYKYTIGKSNYENDRVHGFVRIGDPRRADAVFDQFKIGNSVDIHYNPQRPNLSFVIVDEATTEINEAWLGFRIVFYSLLIILGMLGILGPYL